jgi:hypothetical protein
MGGLGALIAPWLFELAATCFWNLLVTFPVVPPAVTIAIGWVWWGDDSERKA